jgi:hypothetical protein
MLVNAANIIVQGVVGDGIFQRRYTSILENRHMSRQRYI